MLHKGLTNYRKGVYCTYCLWHQNKPKVSTFILVAFQYFCYYTKYTFLHSEKPFWNTNCSMQWITENSFHSIRNADSVFFIRLLMKLQSILSVKLISKQMCDYSSTQLTDPTHETCMQQNIKHISWCDI